METVQLNNGGTFPILGTGTNTYGKEGNAYQGELNGDFSALESAIDLGYRLIDTAISYRNEEGVGKTVAASGLPREEFFLTTKIPPKEGYIDDKDTVRKTVDQSLKNLQSEYIDLYLIHQPIENLKQLQDTWEVLEEYVEAGKLKAIGVSNFSIEQLQSLQSFAKIPLAVNQIQINPKQWNSDVIDYCLEQGIVPEAWGPMKAEEEQQETLAKIGEKYGKSWGQVLLRYYIEQGIMVIPKSHNPQNQKANLEIFNFSLTDEDRVMIAQL